MSKDGRSSRHGREGGHPRQRSAIIVLRIAAVGLRQNNEGKRWATRRARPTINYSSERHVLVELVADERRLHVTRADREIAEVLALFAFLRVPEEYRL